MTWKLKFNYLNFINDHLSQNLILNSHICVVGTWLDGKCISILGRQTAEQYSKMTWKELVVPLRALLPSPPFLNITFRDTMILVCLWLKKMLSPSLEIHVPSTYGTIDPFITN